MRIKNVSGSAYLLGSVLCWGTTPVFLRELIGSIDAWTANGIRYPLAAVLYWPVLALAWRNSELNCAFLKRCFVPAVLALSGQILWACAPYYLPASAIGFFVRTSLVWSLIGAMVLFHDERRLLKLPRFYVGLLLTVVGFAAMAASKVEFDEEVTAFGVVIMLFCSMFFGLYAVSVRRFLRGLSPLLAFGGVSQLVSLGTLVLMFSVGGYTDLNSLPSSNWCVLVASSILGVAFGHFFLYSAVRVLGAAITSGVQSVTPFVTVLLATLFLEESMSVAEWCAGVTMVVGAAVLLFAQQQLDGKSANV